MRKTATRTVLTGIVLFSVVGCAGPKVVTNITGRDDQAKFLYYQQKFLTSEQGLVQCRVASNGDVSNCARKPVFFEE